MNHFEANLSKYGYEYIITNLPGKYIYVNEWFDHYVIGSMVLFMQKKKPDLGLLISSEKHQSQGKLSCTLIRVKSNKLNQNSTFNLQI